MAKVRADESDAKATVSGMHVKRLSGRLKSIFTDTDTKAGPLALRSVAMDFAHVMADRDLQTLRENTAELQRFLREDAREPWQAGTPEEAYRNGALVTLVDLALSFDESLSIRSDSETEPEQLPPVTLGEVAERLLAVLAETPRARPSDLAVRVSAPRYQVTRALQKLARKGTVVSEPDPSDGRGRLYSWVHAEDEKDGPSLPARVVRRIDDRFAVIKPSSGRVVQLFDSRTDAIAKARSIVRGQGGGHVVLEEDVLEPV